MSNPTGMGNSTARHLEEVHNQMLRHINQNNHRHAHSVHSHVHESRPAPEAAHALNASHHSYHAAARAPPPSPSCWQWKFKPSTTYSIGGTSYPRKIAVADVITNNQLDLIVVNCLDGNTIFIADASPYGVDVGDIDNDNCPDIFVAK
ncbi:unnamed protein product [Adineta ricciae]|uniref:Uncharacterized protein n=1 Tax=Adineta ricciae TaxID=249248 RepID=A0A813TXP8_ADIRI|nr:unnamed protein product [Adineta ricciae]